MKLRESILYPLVVILALLYVYFMPDYRTVVIDGRKWNVIADYDNAGEAAAMLAGVHKDMVRFMRYLVDKYQVDKIPAVAPANTDLFNIVSALVKNYNPDEFYENDPRFSGETSYTKGKGSSMYICIRHREDPTKLVDRGMLFFVILHEMAHIGNYNGWAHKPRFWEVFKFLLAEARASGIYVPVNYAEHPMQYCGLNVAYNPLFDPSIAVIGGV
jgi:hypothetical protein